jgi:hypothetical protein
MKKEKEKKERNPPGNKELCHSNDVAVSWSE